MKTWNKYMKNEWIILLPIILICIGINENTENLFWNNLSYWVGNISFWLLMALVAVRTFFAIKNTIKDGRNK